MIRRFIEVYLGNTLVRVTPFVGETQGDNPTKSFGVSLKNITDADCVGDFKIIFNSPDAAEFLIRKIRDAEKLWTEESKTVSDN